MTAGRGSRVLFLTSNYPRWRNDSTTPFVHDLAVGLTGRGWGVTVLAPHAPGAARRESLDGVDVRRFRYLLPESAQTLCYGGGALVNLRESRRARAAVPALVLAEWSATYRQLAAGTDLVHAHWVLPQGFVAATTPWRRVPRVLTVHGGDVYGLRSKVTDRFTRFSLRHVDRVTVGSSATEEVVRTLGSPGLVVERAPMGVDFSRRPTASLVDEVRRRHRRGAGPLLVFVGRVVEEKGVEDVVRAVAALAPGLPDVSAVIAGTGQHSRRVSALAVELGVADRVHLPGWLAPADVPSWFAAADVVLAPSRVGPGGWTEGQGLSIIEAMAVGRPVIATCTGGIPDTITDGETGILVPPADPEAVAGAVRDLVSAGTRAGDMGRKAAAAVTTRFGKDASLDRFESIYRELLEPGGGKVAG